MGAGSAARSLLAIRPAYGGSGTLLSRTRDRFGLADTVLRRAQITTSGTGAAPCPAACSCRGALPVNLPAPHQNADVHSTPAFPVDLLAEAKIAPLPTAGPSLTAAGGGTAGYLYPI